MKRFSSMTTTQIARICGVSQGTVDRALHDRPGIKEETKARILEVAREFAYVPSVKGARQDGKSMLIGVVLCNMILKPWVGRIRPYDYQLEHFGKTIQLLVATPHDYSFPSGHTIASFEAAVALTVHNRKLGIPAMILAVLIAFSRMYLYVHYPTDVLASVILGTAIAFLGCFLAKKLYAFLAVNLKKA